MPLILVPVDFSDCAAYVLGEAVRFARAFGARLVLLHASDPPRGVSLTAMVHPPDGGAERPVATLLREDAEAHLAPLLAVAREQGVEAEGRVAFGRASSSILDAAEQEGAAMIVMGTHGRTGLLRLAHGSVAEDVMHRAEVPVITVRTRHHAGCAASSCDACDVSLTPIERAIAAEDKG